MHAHTQSLSAARNRKGIESSPLGQSRGASSLGNQGPLHELLSRDLTDMLNKGGEGRGRGREREGEGRGPLNLPHPDASMCTHSWKVLSHTSSDTCQLGQFTQNMLQRCKMVCRVHLWGPRGSSHLLLGSPAVPLALAIRALFMNCSREISRNTKRVQRCKMVCGVHLCQLNQVHWSSVSADLGPMQNLLDLLTSNLSHESSQKLPFVSFHSTYMKRMIYESLYHNLYHNAWAFP